MNPNTPHAGGAPSALEPLTFPLSGSRLIEASAGTGKTWTIAALYLRLVLGHGGEQAFARPLTPPEILVVTFTEAATKELRERIRARLAEAADCFHADPATVEVLAPGKDLLHDLRASYDPEAWPGCARRLQLAAEWMDEAAVSTIHGWCNRMLREHAFDSGSLFTQALEADPGELLDEVVRDYWRSFMVPLGMEAVAEVQHWWKGPADLQSSLRKLLEHAALLEPADAPAALLEQNLEERQHMLAALKAPWTAWVDELEALLDQAVADKVVDGRKIQARYYRPWLAALRAWAQDPRMIEPELGKGWERLTPDGLAEAWKQGAPPAHPALDGMHELRLALDGMTDARNDILRHAARWVAERFEAEQQRRAQMGFNDLLTRLEAALRGPNGERLAERIRQAFPVALIDEFQDTDPVQYRIFDAVYKVADNGPETAIILIGDPKQAIYAFRGADIHTYLMARRDCAGRLYTLRRNFRSTHAMVAASNRCFELAEAREEGAGAFLFRDAGENPVPFLPAEAQGRREVLEVEGEAVPALTAWWLPANDNGKATSKGDYLARMGAACASEMVRLLQLGRSGQAGFREQGAWRPLQPKDLAVLVGTHREAGVIRDALAACGVRSVYLSDRESVFQSPQAGELEHWLAACAEPDEPRLLRAALATPTLGLGWDELERLNQDELAWEARVLQFRALREAWRRQGVLPMLRRLLNEFGVPARLLGPAAVDGERILTDLLHLAELLQQASTLLEGEHALLRHLAEQRVEAARGVASAGGDARQIRLESDADLVQVVTVHKSKGLEYPLVFLPFACSWNGVKQDDMPLKYHDEDGRLHIALEGDEEILALADRERLGEDLRKLYVALTRARHATWAGLAPLDKLEQSGFGYLLAGGQPIGAGELEARLLALRGDCADIHVAPAPEGRDARLAPEQEVALAGGARLPARPVREHWWVASYSALKTAGEGLPAAAETPAEDLFHEARQLPAAAVEPVRPSPGSLHAFPRGAEAGTFLHDLLEWAADEGFARVAADEALLRDAIARRCAVRGWEAWIDMLVAWMRDLLGAPLALADTPGRAAGAVPLAGLAGVRAELEFWIAAHAVDTQAIDRLVCAHTLDAAPRPVLLPGQLNGMLKGFIDLVFEHEGCYYVADYKSNWLGPDESAYTPAAMRAAILEARYDLQYVLYLLALHRLLKARLPGYDYDRHVGGAVYLFLRGCRAPGQGVHADRPPRALIERLDALFARAGKKESA
ncbi:MAG TPA: exodeoxyribonuclease V subunit beta [Chromatiales bacterium]|nr:exodeoxyribonuclease V subunit beta [Chromatiales bacterium]